VGKLVADEYADPDDHQEGEDDNCNYRRHTAQVPTAQKQHEWRERKPQKDRKGHRNEDFPSEVQRSNGNDTDGQGPQACRGSMGGMDLHPMRAGSGFVALTPMGVSVPFGPLLFQDP